MTFSRTILAGRDAVMAYAPRRKCGFRLQPEGWRDCQHTRYQSPSVSRAPKST